MQIAIDTSTGFASLALARDGVPLAEMTWRCGQNHAVELLPALSKLLELAGVGIGSASGIIVALGPGSFNGLRVGLGTAKGMAFSLDIPIVGISTLAVEAYQALSTGRGLPACAIHSAGRGEIAAAAYVLVGEEMVTIEPEQVTTLESLCGRLTGPTVFCGDHVPEVAGDIRRFLGEKAIFTSGAANLRRAGFLSELGFRRLRRGDHDDASTIQPMYLRAPPITQPKERK